MIDIRTTIKRLEAHLKALTITIGERSIRRPDHLEKTAGYIESVYGEMGLPVRREPYDYRGLTVANLVADIPLGRNPVRHYLLGAHYDTVAGTPGADDNASAVAVQLETARLLSKIRGRKNRGISVRCVSFVLEEPPAYGTRLMGSRVYARKAKKKREPIDGMICLEMVGYTCRKAGCQDYPFPLMFMGYPKEGNFIGIVGDFDSRALTRSLFRAFRANPDLPVVRLTVPSKGWLLPPVRLSDHASFWDAGYKAVMVTDTAFYRNPHYHRPSDKMETLDFRFMAELVRSLVIFFASH